MHDKKELKALMLGAIGVVYGDIGTSPLYALKETLSGSHALGLDEPRVLGVLSLIFWAVMMLVTIKYVTLIMRADNRGEGGSLALLALVADALKNSKRRVWVVGVLGIFAAALFYGDSMITPAISVLSAVEGMKIIAPHFGPAVIPTTAAILTGLFWIQKRGTGTVGLWFGPIMCLWFATLALLGARQIISNPAVLYAINPLYAIKLIVAHPHQTFLGLGAVVLAVTGGEALYTDMGHFGRRPIRLSWFTFVMPALLLNYFGQGALLLANPDALENPFFLLAPDWALVPLVVLATMATVIASQAVISGAFSVARQAIQLGYLPRMQIVHTSGHAQGQIYVPFTNWTLYLAVMALVIGFQSSSNLAAAYGIAVTGTMLIDTILITFVMILIWKWPRWQIATLCGFLLAIDFCFLASNSLKILQGGWFPLVVGLGSFTVLTTWKRGRALVFDKMVEQSVPLDALLMSVNEIHRVEGVAVFMTGSRFGAPTALLHNLKHNKILHERVFLVTIVTTDTPYVTREERVEYTILGHGFYRLVVRFGFMEHPDLPEALAELKQYGHHLKMMETTFYLSREVIVPTLKHGMALWRERLFAFMSKNAMSAYEFFRIPTDRVVEIGTQLEI
ncbi:MAG: potassium transporter Kup [Proteobacteria bacterium]|nr:potassium transporter Kup [Pseudomonadota bacterium]